MSRGVADSSAMVVFLLLLMGCTNDDLFENKDQGAPLNRKVTSIRFFSTSEKKKAVLVDGLL